MEPSPSMSPAAGQGNGTGASLGKARVSRVAVALDCAFEVHRHDHIQAIGRPTGVPPIEYVPGWTADRPKIASFGFAMARFQVLDGRFIYLHISTGQNAGSDLLVNGLQPIGRQLHPARQRLAREVQPVALRVDLLLPIERQVVAVFAD